MTGDHGNSLTQHNGKDVPPLAYDVDSSFAGVLFFFSPSGERYPVEIGGEVIPTFMPL
jgi:hypothetical protein